MVPECSNIVGIPYRDTWCGMDWVASGGERGVGCRLHQSPTKLSEDPNRSVAYECTLQSSPKHAPRACGTISQGMVMSGGAQIWCNIDFVNWKLR